ncbi:FapA family protein [Rhodoferax saidenbachensis]|uniref:Uncharacterized protein (DUF342 family) n=1 Tax=Rhodoferax saidenbachensis TaxID=1484693 RepID=A0ABU1ZNE2_9BURK|nr:FapA family protein [Rhodoferax saidenbachensis]MDR7307065.1 uncharacterized protein (DUF342 family) [Rhodoferax saidenbachensis]
MDTVGTTTSAEDKARIVVHVAADAMSAALDLSPSADGRNATLDEVMAALAEAGITYGLDHEVVLAACTQGQAAQLVVARGTAPVHGVDAIFEPLALDASVRAPKIDAQGLVDYREFSGICLVTQGAPLMRRTPASWGSEGRTITGKPLPSVPGKDLPFADGLTGAAVSRDDPYLLCATIQGQPVLVVQGVQVEPVLRVAEVNLATGNIYFDGCVQVEGDVTHSMKVQATGDVSVGGTVEGGSVESGGNVLVGGGIIAQGQVVSGGGVTARFTQSAKVKAETAIVLHDMALESELQAGSHIVIGEKTPQKGKLVGGKTAAMMLVRVPTLGSPKSGTTTVSVGANPELEQRYQALQERIDMEKANEDKLSKLVAHLTQTGDPKAMLARVKASWQQATQTWAKSLVEQAELDALLATTRNAKVQVMQGTLGVVELAFGKRRTTLHKEFAAGDFSVAQDNKIQFTDAGGQAYPIS